LLTLYPSNWSTEISKLVFGVLGIFGDSKLTHYAFAARHAVNGHSEHGVQTHRISKTQPSAEHTKSSRVPSPGDSGWQSPGAGHTTHIFPHCLPGGAGAGSIPFQSGACFEAPATWHVHLCVDGCCLATSSQGSTWRQLCRPVGPTGTSKDQGSAKEQRHFILATTTQGCITKTRALELRNRALLEPFDSLRICIFNKMTMEVTQSIQSTQYLVH